MLAIAAEAAPALPLLPLFARALASRDDEVRQAAAAALGVIGVRAVPALLLAARFGDARGPQRRAGGASRRCRRARRRSTSFIDGEARELLATRAAAAPRRPRWAARSSTSGSPSAPVRSPGRCCCSSSRPARARPPGVQAATRRIAGAGSGGDPARRPARAQALEALDAVLPRPLASRVIPALDEIPVDDPPPLDDAIPTTSSSRPADRGGAGAAPLLASRWAPGSSGRAAHGEDIRAAARAAGSSLDPFRLIRRNRDADEEVPTTDEAIQLLKALPLLAGLSPSQLAELAEAVSWTTRPAGERADVGEDALFFVQTGRVRVGTEEIQSFGERALLGGEPVPAAIAVEKTRLLRLAREDFERICNDTPGIALAICRVLARR